MKSTFLFLFVIVLFQDVSVFASTIPTPSAPQLRYQSTDFVALIHFNMATFSKDGDPGCSAENWNVHAPYATGPTSDPRTFNPVKLNTTQWFDSITALGANIAILTAKHGCGFLLWPTQAVFDEDEDEHPRPYGYHTEHDLLQDFVTSAKSAGVGYGFYYSIMKNFFLCRSFKGTNSCTSGSDDDDETARGVALPGQFNVSDAEYLNLVTQHVRELWTHYGDFTEIWVDSQLPDGLADMMVRLQPTAAGTPAHPRSWCGTESGHPSVDVGGGPIWQTGGGAFGDPNSEEWVDKFCDPQLFRDHIWFWEPGRPVRTLEEMIPIYHDIVGRGMVMELAFAINREGLVDSTHEKVYRQLGDWVRSCYGAPIIAIATTTTISGTTTGNDNEFRLQIPKGALFDRIQIKEDIVVGQRIRNYTIAIAIDGDGNGGEVLIPDGISVGRKRIHLLENTYLAANEQTLVLTITHAIAPPQISMFGVFAPCHPNALNDTMALEIS
jgi:alpha-L-fucosidase